MIPLTFDGVGTTSAPYYCVIGQEETTSGEKSATAGEWPFNDPGTMARLKQSAEQAARGELKSLGSFAKYAEE